MNEPTSFINKKLTTTDLFITNEQSSLINYSTCETGIFDYYKMLDAFFEANFIRGKIEFINYRCLQNLTHYVFKKIDR